MQHKGEGWEVRGPEDRTDKERLAKAKAVKRTRYKRWRAGGFAYAYPPKQGKAQLSGEIKGDVTVDWGWGAIRGPSDGSQIVEGPFDPERKKLVFDTTPYPVQIPDTIAALFKLGDWLVFVDGHCVLLEKDAGLECWAAWAKADYHPKCEGLVFLVPPWDPKGYIVGWAEHIPMLIAYGIGGASAAFGDVPDIVARARQVVRGEHERC